MFSRWLKTTNAVLPLALMLLLGGGWWALSTFAVSEDGMSTSPQVQVTATEWSVAVDDLESSLRRQASDREARAMLERLIEDEILLQQGLEDRPWRWDPVVRRRLAELVRFFDETEADNEGIAGQAEADEQAETVSALIERAGNYEIYINGTKLNLEQEWQRIQ
jgi:hypothetical protein